tara:strand:- start:706 stop:1608 length:903 start_codon:yes stop_codon:yes gene_type:complete
LKKTITKKELKKPSATTLGTPVYHRRRRDWRDDQYLIEEILKNTDNENWRKLNSDHRIKGFKGLVSGIESLGYQSNDNAYTLAMWIREELSKLASEKGGYDLRVHALKFPPRISNFIDQRCKVSPLTKLKPSTQIPIEVLFPDIQIKEYVLERVRLLHKGNLISYLNCLVVNERNSLNGDSAKIFDLIQICQEKLKRRNLKAVSSFTANEVDIWVPGLGLGIEIRDEIYRGNNEKEELITILENTNRSKKTKFLVVVCPDNLPDLIFHNWREIERDGLIPNLSFIRVGDLGIYLDRLGDQ